jgi:hypothetical protein
MKKIATYLFFLVFTFLFSQCKKTDSNSGSSNATITALSCTSVSYNSTATAGTAFNATGTIPYAGGNAISFTAGTAIVSTGVTGLTATLQAGILANGTGNLSYTVSGTPSAAGIATFAISFGGQSCSINLTVNAAGGGGTLPSVYSKIYGATSITFDGTWVTIKSTGTPDHKSVYYPTTNPLYEAFSGTTFGGTTFAKNPNTIATQTLTFKIPVNPALNTAHAATPLGPIGIAINGVALFNQYAGPNNQPLTNEITSFDQSWAHPQQNGMYHYHVEPLKLSQLKGRSALMGFLLDGFPVYGPDEENGTAPTNLDVYHGHTHTTVDFPSGMYHYHFTLAAPYLNGNGFYGTPGTVTQ